MATPLDTLPRPNSPRWIKFTLTYAALAVAGLTNDVELYSLPAGGVLHAVKAKHSTPFSGGIIAAYTVSVGIAGNFTKYMAAFDVFQAAGSAVKSFSELPDAEDHASATSIRARAVAVGAFLNAASAGSVDLWLLVSLAK